MSKKPNPVWDGAYVANLLIEANFSAEGRLSPHALALFSRLSCNAFPSTGGQLSLRTLLPLLLRGPFLTLQTSTFVRTPGCLLLTIPGYLRERGLRTRFASIMRNVYPANGGGRGVEAVRFLAEKGRERRRDDEKKGRKERRGLPSYRRRIELRFLSNSEDRANLKGAGSRR